MKESEFKIFNTPTGQIKALKHKGTIKALKIPYAQAVRFGIPTPITKNTQPIEAYTPSPACPQLKKPLFSEIYGIDALNKFEQSEDCLNLSVTRPDNDYDNLPVMVWIHGGSYITGAGDSLVYDPLSIVLEQNVIFVSVTYRLGLIGFLGGYNNVHPNLGFLDIIEAIKWINRNISSFGGNTKNITLFGQSAGGDAIAQLLLVEETKGLFQNAIIQSAPLGVIFNKEKMHKEMIEIAKQIPDDISINDLLNKQEDVFAVASKYGLHAGMPLGNQYGLHPFPDESSIESSWSKRAKDVNVLIGYAKDETSFFVLFSDSFKKISKIPILGPLFKFIIVKITTNKVYKKQSKKLTRILSKNKGNVYLYEITWGSRINGLGATHTIDLPLLFGDSSLWEKSILVSGISADSLSESGKKVRNLWAKFARTGQLEKKGQLDGILKYKKIMK